MHAPMNELDEVMDACTRIFQLWDNEVDKVQAIFREIGKRQRTDVKFPYRTPYRHMDLEKRLGELQKFRF